jgi:DNA polymerase-3 subunit delta
MATDSRQFTYICGPDDFLVNRIARVRFAGMAEGLDEFSSEVISGFTNNIGEVEATINRLRDAVQTLGLFGDRKAVWLKDVNFLADSVTGRAEGTLKLLDELKAILERIVADEVALLISASPVDRRRVFPKWMEKNSDFQLVTDSGGGMGWEDLAAEELAGMDIRFAPGAIELLVAKINGNARLFVEEVRKLITYCDEVGGVIDARMIDELVPAFGEGDFFEATEAFFAREPEWCVQALRRHFFAGNDARPLLSSLQNRNRLLIQLGSLKDSGFLLLTGGGIDKKSFERSAARYGGVFGSSKEKNPMNVFTQNPWYMGKLVGKGGLPSLRSLINHQLEFRQAFAETIERPNDQEDILRAMMLRCLSTGGTR